ncbi:MAG: hypothetical protein ACR2N3_09055, partial [Pyrinomonadaceae bacterium]
IISVKSVPKSLPTLTLFLACDLRKVLQTLYADSFACITTCYARLVFTSRELLLKFFRLF